MLSVRYLTLFSHPCFAILKALSVQSKQTSSLTPRALTPSTLAKSQTFLKIKMPSLINDLGCSSTLTACVQYVYEPKMSEMILSCYRCESDFFSHLLVTLFSYKCVMLTTQKVVPWGVTQSTSCIDCCFKVVSYSPWFFGVGVSNVILSRNTF